MALGALAALRDAGLRVPDDIGVAGFDDITRCATSSPASPPCASRWPRWGRRSSASPSTAIPAPCAALRVRGEIVLAGVAPPCAAPVAGKRLPTEAMAS